MSISDFTPAAAASTRTRKAPGQKIPLREALARAFFGEPPATPLAERLQAREQERSDYEDLLEAARSAPRGGNVLQNVLMGVVGGLPKDVGEVLSGFSPYHMMRGAESMGSELGTAAATGRLGEFVSKYPAEVGGTFLPAMTVFHGTPHRFKPTPDIAGMAEFPARKYTLRDVLPREAHEHFKDVLDVQALQMGRPHGKRGTYRTIDPTEARNIGVDPEHVFLYNNADLNTVYHEAIHALRARKGRPMDPVFAEPGAEKGSAYWQKRFPGNPLGEFDLSKIGTGEGAQAYGHGIYLAESPMIAKSYAEKLQLQPSVKYKGEVLWKGSGGEVGRGRHKPEVEGPAWARLMGYAGSYRKAINIAKKEIAKEEAALGRIETFKDSAPETYESLKRTSEDTIARQKLLIEDLKKYGKDAEYDPGLRTYRVDLPDEHIARMLDWDAPLGRDFVKKATPKAMGLIEAEYNGVRGYKDPVTGRLVGTAFRTSDTGPALEARWIKAMDFGSGRDFYQRLGNNEMASRLLAQAGIPGIRYFDATSRAAGQGTRNFVLFDPSISKIIGLED